MQGPLHFTNEIWCYLVSLLYVWYVETDFATRFFDIREWKKSNYFAKLNVLRRIYCYKMSSHKFRFTSIIRRLQLNITFMSSFHAILIVDIHWKVLDFGTMEYDLWLSVYEHYISQCRYFSDIINLVFCMYFSKLNKDEYAIETSTCDFWVYTKHFCRSVEVT